MPTMFEIYKNHSAEYDELVSAEDYQDNLGAFLRRKIEWNGKNVYEAGIGTGRMTKYYIKSAASCRGYDREMHMLEKCRSNLSSFMDKITLGQAQNLDLPVPEILSDVFIEGWSLGHTADEYAETISDVCGRMVNRIKEIVKPGGDILIVESLGTHVEKAGIANKALNDFHTYLENEAGFERNELRTDYKFNSTADAARICGFFFGGNMGRDIMDKKLSVVREYTGVWYLKNI